MLWNGNFALRPDVTDASRPDEAKDKLEHLFNDALAVRQKYNAESRDILSEEELLRLRKAWITDTWRIRKPKLSWLDNASEDEMNETKQSCFRGLLEEACTCEFFFMPLVGNAFVEDADNAQCLTIALLQIPFLSRVPSGCEAKRRRKS